MAVYGTDIRTGVARQGKIIFTGWTGILADGGNTPPGGAAQGTTGTVGFNGQFQNDDRIAKFFRKPSPAIQALRHMWFQLTGAAAGVATAAQAYKRVLATDINTPGGGSANLGGLRVIEDAGYPSRATTTADRDAFKEILVRRTFPTVPGTLVSVNGRTMAYPVDVSGVGGGGKVAF